MKLILTIFLSIIYNLGSYANCSGTGLWVFPNEKEINKNSIFIIDGYGNSQDIIKSLNTDYKVYLMNEGTKINLIVSEINIGQFSITQAILKPETELEIGKEYTLIIEGNNENEILNRYNNETNKYEQIKYTVTAKKDLEKPNIKSNPKEINKSLVQLGCGPEIYVVFDATVEDSSEIIVKASVKNLRTNKITTYCIQQEGTTIKIGRGMCSGAFNFTEGEEYEVDFAFMDSSGNITKMNCEPIQFTKPTKLTR